MSSRLRPGQVLTNPASGATFVVVRRGTTDVAPECDGRPLVEGGRVSCGESLDIGPDANCLRPGQRYADRDGQLILLCIRAGGRSLTVAGQPMTALAMPFDPRRACLSR